MKWKAMFHTSLVATSEPWFHVDWRDQICASYPVFVFKSNAVNLSVRAGFLTGPRSPQKGGEGRGCHHSPPNLTPQQPPQQWGQVTSPQIVLWEESGRLLSFLPPPSPQPRDISGCFWWVSFDITSCCRWPSAEMGVVNRFAEEWHQWGPTAS